MTRPYLFIVLPLLSALPLGCGSVEDRSPASQVVVFHAGSLSVPFLEIAEAFEREYPGVRVIREAAGSRTCARKITDLNRRCDVFASADYAVIDELLFPDYADWSILFAGNELCLAYHSQSLGAGELTDANWIDTLLTPAVHYARSDPDSDPCGYRTVQAFQLAEQHYARSGSAQSLLSKDLRFIRPKGSDLIALLETRSVDYAFIYRSVAEQHGIDYLRLPDEVNLSDSDLAELYATAVATVSGREPGDTSNIRATPMRYGVTIPKNAPNPSGAEAFVSFLLHPDHGLAILRKHHQTLTKPTVRGAFAQVPVGLQARIAEEPVPAS
ncbi:MAG: extracellular solute-binding protein [Candidatus Hydrogenedentes bacterium]|nr:extracellular solute-binding protein [Candidatus Hydrogenedentota bacterium]